MVWKFPGKFSRKSKISERRNTEWKIPEKKLNGTEIPAKKKFRKFRYTSQGCPLRKLRNILFHSSLKISRNWNRNFLSNEKRPRLYSFCKFRGMLSHSLLEIFGRTGSAHFHSSCVCVYPQHLRWCVIKLHKTCQRYFIISYRCFFFATRYLTNSMKYWCW